MAKTQTFDKQQQLALIRSYRTLWNGLQKVKKQAAKKKDTKLEILTDKFLLKAELQLISVRKRYDLR